MIDVCICTHFPKKSTFALVLRALGEQTLSKKKYQVVIIDNANSPAISFDEAPFSILKEMGVDSKIIREPRIGIAAARIRALNETQGETLVFVDDDNVLEKNFLKKAQEILDENSDVGCFSGKVFLHKNVAVPKWAEPLLGSLAIKDEGNEPIIDWFRGTWTKWVPAATASMVLRRSVAKTFLKNHASRPEIYEFGRKGRHNLMSGEDFLIALSAADAGLKCGYFPQLKMHHLIRADRFTLRRMAKLFFSFGITDLKRETYLNLPLKPFRAIELQHRLLALNYKNTGIKARFCYWIYEMTYVSGKTFQLIRSGQPFYIPKGGTGG